MKIQSIFGILLALLLISSCSKDDDNTLDNVRGKYILDAFSSTGCNDSSDNLTLTKDGDKLCTPDGCTEMCLEFLEDMYKLKVTISSSAFSLTQTDEGSFDRAADSNTVCIDGDCGELDISDGGKTIKMSYTDPDDGCTYSLTFKKQ